MTLLRVLPALFLFAADRFLKWHATNSLPPEGVLSIPGIFSLEYYKNYGIAFSIPLPRLVIIGATFLALFLALRHVRKNLSLLSALCSPGFSLFLLGAGSNLWDRLKLGYVIDYLKLGPVSYVNIADGMVIAGLLLILLRRTK